MWKHALQLVVKLLSNNDNQGSIHWNYDGGNGYNTISRYQQQEHVSSKMYLLRSGSLSFLYPSM
jgi:hypothetical protein